MFRLDFLKRTYFGSQIHNRRIKTQSCMPSVHADQQIIEELLQGRETTLRRIYPQYADAFRAWARRHFQCNDAELQDAYQDAMTAFYRNVMTGQLTILTSSLKTYLFAIGYRILLRAIAHNRPIKLVAEMSDNDMPSDPDFLQMIINEADYQAQKQRLSTAIAQLGEACQRILVLFFYEKFSIPQIKEQLNYQSENSVSVQKSRCLKSLKDILER
jgi:RNA polymerase sigma factor (sigma-70 family)